MDTALEEIHYCTYI